MLAKAANRNLIKGLSTSQGREVISLQYADDTILFSSIDRPLLENLKNTLTLFEQISGMRINFHKCELIPLNLEDSQTHDIAHIFSCPIGNFPIKYLGVPLHFEKLKREDIRPLVDTIMQKISGWKGKLLSYADRVTLIRTCIAYIPVYLLSFIKFPKWAIRTISFPIWPIASGMTIMICTDGTWLTRRASPCVKSMEVWVYPTLETSICAFWDPGSRDISKMMGNYGNNL
jgi:hypothetical protein